MPTFAVLSEIITSNNDDDPLQDGGDNAGGAAATYIKQDSEFWNQLAELANGDPEGLSAMLGLSKSQIATWHSKIKQAALEAEKHTAEKQPTQMMPTGVPQ